MKLYEIETSHFLQFLAHQKHRGYMLKFMTEDIYADHTSDMQDGAIITEIDADDLPFILPTPYNSKRFAPYLNRAVMITPLNDIKGDDKVHHKTIYIEVLDITDKKPSKKLAEFRKLMVNPAAKGIVREYLGSSEKDKPLTTLASVSGLSDSKDKAYEYESKKLHEDIRNSSYIQNLMKENSLLDVNVSPAEYGTFLHIMISDPRDDFNLALKVFDAGKMYYHSVDVYENFMEDIRNLHIRYLISDQKIKMLTTTLLGRWPNYIPMLEMLRTSIPDKYIIHRDMPLLNLNPVKL